jgi:hypothetical protein
VRTIVHARGDDGRLQQTISRATSIKSGPVFSRSNGVRGSSHWLWSSIDAHDAASAKASSRILRRSMVREISGVVRLSFGGMARLP